MYYTKVYLAANQYCTFNSNINRFIDIPVSQTDKNLLFISSKLINNKLHDNICVVKNIWLTGLLINLENYLISIPIIMFIFKKILTLIVALFCYFFLQHDKYINSLFVYLFFSVCIGPVDLQYVESIQRHEALLLIIIIIIIVVVFFLIEISKIYQWSCFTIVGIIYCGSSYYFHLSIFVLSTVWAIKYFQIVYLFISHYGTQSLSFLSVF